MTRRPPRRVALPRLAVLCAPALLVASAVAHATGGDGGTALGARNIVRPAVVVVGDGPGATATGFAVGDGRVVTVAHVLDGPAVTVRGADGIARRATVLRRDDALDLAVLGAPGVEPAGPAAGAGVLAARDRGAVSLRATVVRRADATVRAGDGRVLARRPVLELRVPIRSGDSGAPLLDARGRVVGVVFARSRERDGVAYAVDASVLARLLR